MGRLTSVTDPMNGITEYTWDSRDNRLTVTDANDHTHTFTYDKTNRVKTEQRPMGETIGYLYDDIGNLRSRTSPGGERRVFTYDEAGRRTGERIYAPGASDENPSQTIDYGYNARNLLTGYTQTGNTTSSATYAYDANGQKTGETITYGSGATAFSKTLHYGYAPNGLQTSLTWPGGTQQTTSYDASRLDSIGIKGYSVDYQDYQWRVPTKVTLPGAVRTISLDALQRPTRIKSQATGGAIIMDYRYRYRYDPAGNITQRGSPRHTEGATHRAPRAPRGQV